MSADEKRGLSVLRGADGATDTLEGFADGEVAGSWPASS